MKYIIYIKNSICFDKESKVNINSFRMTNFLGMGMMEIHASMFWNNEKQLNQLNTSFLKMLTIPTVANTYKETIDHLNDLRVVALSGGYSRDEANVKLKENDGLIASFSRALPQDLNVNQTDEEFNAALKDAIDSIFDASVNKNA